MHAHDLTTKNFLTCLLKTLVFTVTITIELLCGFSSSDVRPFYLTILLQAINNIYDSTSCIANAPKSFSIASSQGIAIFLAVVDAILAMVFIFIPETAFLSSSGFTIFLSSLFIAGVPVILYHELYLHLQSLKHPPAVPPRASISGKEQLFHQDELTDKDEALLWKFKETFS